MVDTHAHIGLCEGDPATVVALAEESGVRRILTVGLDERSNREAIELARRHEAVHAAVGRHPNAAQGFDERAEADLRELAADPAVVAVGETGMDFYRSDPDDKDGPWRGDQLRSLRAHIGVARDASKPLVIHMRSGTGRGRDAVRETLDVLATEADGLSVILHCFSASPDRVGEAAERGWYCSFAGNVTYPGAGELRDAARLVPDDLLLLETDAPFLAPQTRRGKRNQPAFVVETLGCLAEALGVERAELEQTVEANAARVFGW